MTRIGNWNSPGKVDMKDKQIQIHFDDECIFTQAWTESGVYTLWVQAVDAAGNITTSGPYTGLANPGNMVFLPAFFQNTGAAPSSSKIYLPSTYK